MDRVPFSKAAIKHLAQTKKKIKKEQDPCINRSGSFSDDVHYSSWASLEYPGIFMARSVLHLNTPGH